MVCSGKSLIGQVNSKHPRTRILWCSWFAIIIMPMVGVLGIAVQGGVLWNYDLRMLLDRTGNDFGAVPIGPKLECRFRLTNTTDESVTVQKIKTSCGCSAQDNEAHLVEPGESYDLNFLLKTSGGKPTQLLEKTAWVKIEKGRDSKLVPLNMTALLQADISFEPSEICLGSVESQKQEPDVITIRRETLGAKDFAVLRVLGNETQYRIIETLRNKDVIKLAVQRTQDGFTAYPDPIEMQFSSHGITKKETLPVILQETDTSVQILPSSYVASVKKGLEKDELIRSTSQEFELASQMGGNVVIKIIEFDDASAKCLFGWQISEKQPHRLRIWARDADLNEQVTSPVITIFYEHTHEGHTRSGMIPLTAHLLSTQSNGNSMPLASQ